MNEIIIYNLLGTALWCVLLALYHRKVKRQRRDLDWLKRYGSAMLNCYRAESNHSIALMFHIVEQNKRLVELNHDEKIKPIPPSGPDMKDAVQQAARVCMQEGVL